MSLINGEPGINMEGRLDKILKSIYVEAGINVEGGLISEIF